MARGYIGSQLIHWTGRGKSGDEAFASLTSICNEMVLRLSYCPNYVADDLKLKSSMVCFTDIPLRHSREHCGIFGKFGLAFRKERMIEYGANPALYTTNVHFERIKHVADLLSRMLDLEMDREWRQEAESYRFTEDETVALKEVSELLQQYSYRNEDHKEYVTYHQREWRLTFNSLPFAGDNKVHEPGMSCFYIRDGKSYGIFKFAPRDVEFIVVPAMWWWPARRLAKQLGCGLKLYEFSVGT